MNQTPYRLLPQECPAQLKSCVYFCWHEIPHFYIEKILIKKAKYNFYNVYQAVKYNTNTLEARLMVCLASLDTITPSGS